ncbi:hypothetical protein NG783_10560 [Aliarcobacter cryaerophilus]|uniref:hypothetical protein n=1 Tax=Aliarcobacter cryaerophilus TaxID=28198 RepID=UPI003DA65B71
MIEDLVKQREEIEAKIYELRKAEEPYQSFERIRKFRELITATYNLIDIEYKDNPFIKKMEKYGYKTVSICFPFQLDFKHISEDSSFTFVLKTQKMEDIVGIDDVKIRVLQEFLKSQFKN